MLKKITIIVIIYMLFSCSKTYQIMGNWKMTKMTIDGSEPSDFEEWEYLWSFYSPSDFKITCENIGTFDNPGNGTIFTSAGKYVVNDNELYLIFYGTNTILMTNFNGTISTNTVYFSTNTTFQKDYVIKTLFGGILELSNLSSTTNYSYKFRKVF